jgi:dTDP-4-dehydrorhamnose 3,5-epimerase
MLIKLTRFKNLFIIKKKKFNDKRGHFIRDFCKKDLKKIKFNIRQINISYNIVKYTLRGFHYQKKPFEEAKIITCLSGKILNVSIDLRPRSKTYLKIFRKNLSEKNYLSLHIPRGFANAYLTLESHTKVLYYMSQYYKPNKGDGIKYNDKFFSIKWPKPVKNISQKDLNFKNFNEKK